MNRQQFLTVKTFIYVQGTYPISAEKLFFDTVVTHSLFIFRDEYTYTGINIMSYCAFQSINCLNGITPKHKSSINLDMHERLLKWLCTLQTSHPSAKT